MHPLRAIQLQISSSDESNAERLRWASQFDLAVMDLELLPRLVPGSPIMPSAGLPKMYVYFNPVERLPSYGTQQPINAALAAAADDNPLWYVRDASGNQVKYVSYGGGTWSKMLNITNADYRAFVLDMLDGLWSRSRLPRLIWLDRVEETIEYMDGRNSQGSAAGNGQIDLNNNSSGDVLNTIGPTWRTGYIAFIDGLKALGFSVIGNFGWNSHIDYCDHLDAAAIEVFDVAYYTAGLDDKFSMQAQLRSLASCPGDNKLTVSTAYDPLAEDWVRKNRFGLVSALMVHPTGSPKRSAYFCGANAGNAYNEPVLTDYDRRSSELGLVSFPWGRGYLGPAVGPAVLEDGTELCELLLGDDWLEADQQLGYREFDGGICVWNPTDTEITVPNRWGAKYLKGMIDPVNDNGSRPSEITVAARDARVLVFS